MKTKIWAIVLMIICTIFTSSAQILYKVGVDKLHFDLISIITNWYIILGMVLYVIGAFLFIFALRGGEVTTLYPIITSSYIWVIIGSGYFLNEIINMMRVGGSLFIIIGILLIILGEENKKAIKLKNTT